MADVMPVPVRDRLTPSPIPPAFPSWGGSVDGHGSSLEFLHARPPSLAWGSPLLKWGSTSTPGPLMMDSPVPTGTKALLGGLCDRSRVTEGMRPAVLDQADGLRARVLALWAGTGEEGVEGLAADPGEAMVTLPGEADRNGAGA